VQWSFDSRRKSIVLFEAFHCSPSRPSHNIIIENKLDTVVDIHGSVHPRLLSRNTNKMQLCNRIYYSKVYWRLNMFRAAQRSSAGALNFICILWFICPCGDRPLPRQRSVTIWAYKPEDANRVYSSWWWAVCCSKHVEPSINFGIINSITKLHLVGISTEYKLSIGGMTLKGAERHLWRILWQYKWPPSHCCCWVVTVAWHYYSKLQKFFFRGVTPSVVVVN
jgi:hypothetical protein